MMCKKGLTLMELLVVISILATLAALMFPVYLRVKTRTDMHVCAGQLKQIGIALKMYVHDHGGDSPYLVPPTLGTLYPRYVRNKDLLVCPTFRKAAPQVIEEAEKRNIQYHYPVPWGSYYLYDPRVFDEFAKEEKEWLKYGITWVSFSEVYAKRKDQTPIAFCDTHRYGCPFGIEDITAYMPREKVPDCHSLADLSASLIILRWGGSISFVHKPPSRSTKIILLIF